jgi:hypothetical protein
MTATQLFAPRPEVVALVADCMRNLDNNLVFAEIPEWKHEDGSPVTGKEIDVIRGATLGELDVALRHVQRPTRGRLFKPSPMSREMAEVEADAARNEPVDARELSCQGLTNVDPSYSRPIFHPGPDGQYVIGYAEKMARLGEGHVYGCDLIGHGIGD